MLKANCRSQSQKKGISKPTYLNLYPYQACGKTKIRYITIMLMGPEHTQCSTDESQVFPTVQKFVCSPNKDLNFTIFRPLYTKSNQHRLSPFPSGERTTP